MDEQMNEQLNDSMLDSQTLQSILELTPDDLIIVGPDYDILYTNLKPKPGLIETPSLVGEKYYRHCPYLHNGITDLYAKQVFETGSPVTDIQVQIRNGKWLEINSIPIPDPEGNITMVAEFIKDITSFRASSDKESSSTESTYAVGHDAFQQAQRTTQKQDEVAAWSWNTKTNEMDLSDEFFLMLGYEVGSHASAFQTFTKLIHPEDIGQVMKSLQYCMAKKTPAFRREYRMLCSTGQYKWVFGRAQAEWDKEGKATFLHGNHVDLSEKKLKEEEQRYQTLRDSLTELYNRAVFDDTLQRINTRRMHPISIFMVEVVDLIEIESIFGQLAAEKHLTRTSNLLRSIFRQEDVLCRWDEKTFAIVLPKTSATYAKRIDQRIVNACINTGDEVLQPKLSVGYATREALEEEMAITVHQARDRMMKNRNK